MKWRREAAVLIGNLSGQSKTLPSTSHPWSWPRRPADQRAKSGVFDGRVLKRQMHIADEGQLVFSMLKNSEWSSEIGRRHLVNASVNVTSLSRGYDSRGHQE